MAANIEPALSAATLSKEQTENINRFASDLSPEQLVWTSGYLAGMAARSPLPHQFFQAGEAEVAPLIAAVSETQSAPSVTVLYGSETGNSQTVAQNVAEELGKQGNQVTLTNMRDYRTAQLKRETNLVLIVSTHGEGDPPEDAEDFYEFVLGERAPDLGHLNFTVLALGDSSYAHFCETGRQLDERLTQLGGNRLHPRIDCDVDFEANAQSWTEEILDKFKPETTTGGAVIPLRPVQASVEYDKNRPFTAEIVVNQKITGRHSNKDVRHIELSVEDSGLAYEPGDSLGVIPQNSARTVEDTLEHLKLSGSEEVLVNGENKALADSLTHDFELSNLNLGFLETYGKLAAAPDLSSLANPDQASQRSELFKTHQIVDVIRKFPASASPQELVDALPKLSPRLYSIASSPELYPDEVHLTVDVLRYQAFGHEHRGVASNFLTSDQTTSKASIFVDKNPKFRLPSDADAPIIMVGPGTGIAPFRAFIQHREALNAKGKNWLFFGAQHFESDFLYQMEWLRYRKQGLLNNLNVAFSRDQEHKIYVQHVIRDNSRELYHWLEDGAYLYICGDASQMAGDVHQGLLEIIATESNRDLEFAKGYVKELRQQNRYQKDVY